MITQTHLFQKHWNIDIENVKTEFVCKVCHMNLKTGNIQLLDNSTHSRNNETEHNKKDQGEFTSNNSQHDVNVKQIMKDDAYKHNTTQKCFFCETGQPSKYLIFDENEYDNNPFLEICFG